MSNDSGALVGTGLSVSFDGIRALSDVNFELHEREILGLIGPNGAGKTTLVNVLTGFQRIEQGEIRLEPGPRLDTLKPHQIARCGVVRSFQAGRLFSTITTLENIVIAGLGIGLSTARAREQAELLVEWIGLGKYARALAGALPYAEQRRAGIVRALAARPRFLLLDEPAAGMSEPECDHLVEYLAQIPVRFESAILLIEHNIKVIMQVCRRVHVLQSGKTLAIGSPVEVRNNPVVVSAYLGTRAA